MDDILEYLSNKLEDFDIKKLIIPTILLLLYIAGFVYFLTVIKNINKKLDKKETVVEQSHAVIEDFIYVDVKGSVQNPGVYKLDNNSRVIDAISASGGITEEANTRFINLSKQLNDGDVIVVYSKKEINDAKKDNTVYVEVPCVCEEVKNDACFNEEKNESANGKININTATIEELKTLSGIGEAKASSIVEYRNKNGNFKSIEDIKNVSGISESVFVKIKENITI